MKTTLENRLYAFWRYDQYPYMLGGEVDRLDEEGWVYCTKFAGLKFKLALLMQYEDGVELNETLSKLASCYEQDLADLKDRYAKLQQDALGRAIAGMMKS